MTSVDYSCSSTGARKFFITRKYKIVCLDRENPLIFEPLPHIQCPRVLLR